MRPPILNYFSPQRRHRKPPAVVALLEILGMLYALPGLLTLLAMLLDPPPSIRTLILSSFILASALIFFIAAAHLRARSRHWVWTALITALLDLACIVYLCRSALTAALHLRGSDPLDIAPLCLLFPLAAALLTLIVLLAITFHKLGSPT